MNATSYMHISIKVCILIPDHMEKCIFFGLIGSMDIAIISVSKRSGAQKVGQKFVNATTPTHIYE